MIAELFQLLAPLYRLKQLFLGQSLLAVAISGFVVRMH
jgi:hypothetical protein